MESDSDSDSELSPPASREPTSLYVIFPLRHFNGLLLSPQRHAELASPASRGRAVLNHVGKCSEYPSVSTRVPYVHGCSIGKRALAAGGVPRMRAGTATRGPCSRRTTTHPPQPGSLEQHHLCSSRLKRRTIWDGAKGRVAHHVGYSPSPSPSPTQARNSIAH